MRLRIRTPVVEKSLYINYYKVKINERKNKDASIRKVNVY
jgi:hypothetical protein